MAKNVQDAIIKWLHPGGPAKLPTIHRFNGILAAACAALFCQAASGDRKRRLPANLAAPSSGSYAS